VGEDEVSSWIHSDITGSVPLPEFAFRIARKAM
jgi:hypothetical protein